MPDSFTLPYSGTVPTAGSSDLLGTVAFKITINPSTNFQDSAIIGASSQGIGVVGCDVISAEGHPSGPGGGTIPAPTGIAGVSNAGRGVYGYSVGFDAVVGESGSIIHAGVTGRNLNTGTNGGVGIYGVGGQYAGKFDGAVQINGVLDVTNDLIAGGLIANENATVTKDLAVGGTVNVTNDLTAGGLIAKANATVTKDLAVGGTVTVAGDVVLANQDCAEDFDIAACAEFEAGTVMVLDDSGLLQESRHAYDRKVAGVVSGAGEFKPGLILGRDKAHEDGHRAPVALVGKVYCKVDTQLAPIAVGDLLTTSATKGHAMKAEDPMKAFGAVIGKALRSMPAAQTGLIPILVALQ